MPNISIKTADANEMRYYLYKTQTIIPESKPKQVNARGKKESKVTIKVIKAQNNPVKIIKTSYFKV